MKIILFSEDIALVTSWENSIKKSCFILDELDELSIIKDSIVIVDYKSSISKIDELLSQAKVNNNKFLILHKVPDINTAKKLLALGIKGYGNALMRDHFLISAIETIQDGMVWLYPEFTSMLISDIPTNKNKDIDTIMLPLSNRERGVALLLKDGMLYKNIALKLDITPRTVKAHAQKIYSKLNVKDKLALALLLK